MKTEIANNENPIVAAKDEDSLVNYYYNYDQEGRLYLIYNDKGTPATIEDVTLVRSTTVFPNLVCFVPKYHYYDHKNSSIVSKIYRYDFETESVEASGEYRFATNAKGMYYYSLIDGSLIPWDKCEFFYEDGIHQKILVTAFDEISPFNFTALPQYAFGGKKSENFEKLISKFKFGMNYYTDISINQISEETKKLLVSSELFDDKLTRHAIIRYNALIRYSLEFTLPDDDTKEFIGEIFTKHIHECGADKVRERLFCFVDNEDDGLHSYQSIFYEILAEYEEGQAKKPEAASEPPPNVRADTPSAIATELGKHMAKAAEACAALQAAKEERKAYNKATQHERETQSLNRKQAANLVKASLIFHKPFVFRLLSNATELAQAAFAAHIDPVPNLRPDEDGAREVLYWIYGRETDRRRISEYAKALIKARDWDETKFKTRLGEISLTEFVNPPKPKIEKRQDGGYVIWVPQGVDYVVQRFTESQ